MRRRVYNKSNNHSYVDLGLPSGLLWATSNVGTSNPYGDGIYFIYGGDMPSTNTAPPSYYTGTENPIPSSKDQATLNWGSNWRTPTNEEFNELVANTGHTYTTFNNTTYNGLKCTSYIDPEIYIFIPASGYYYYGNISKSWSNRYVYNQQGLLWTSTPITTDSASYFGFFSNASAGCATVSRGQAMPIRAVRSGKVPSDKRRITLQSYSIGLNRWMDGNESRQLTSFTPNTDIQLIACDTDTNDYFVLDEFKAGVSYPIVSTDESYFYLKNETNKEIIVPKKYCKDYYRLDAWLMVPNGSDGQETIGTFNDGTPFTLNNSLYNTSDITINGEDIMVSTSYSIGNGDDIFIDM